MKLWDKGSEPDAKVDRFTVGNDREIDLVLAKYDVLASKAHAQMLQQIGLLTAAETDALEKVLDQIGESIEHGQFTIEKDFEDMHSKIEFLLIEKLGDTGKKIHTARSRNDQVLVAIQLYLRQELEEVRTAVVNLFHQLLSLADKYQEIQLPGYTHLQVAMPSSFGLWFSGYAETLIDDVYFLNAALKITDQNPLGSAAGYGSSFPIDRSFTTDALGFESQKFNVIAAQMGRGKVEKAASFGLAALAATLSKFSMDICLYMSQNFGFVSFPKEYTTGSSIMPHKQNPDVFELIRGKCNIVQALPGQLSLLVNNLPSGYHRDLQLSKQLIIPALQDIKACLDMLQTSLEHIQVKEDIMDDPTYDYVYSVERVNELVQRGLPFRDAYKQVGKEIEEGDFIPNKELRHTHQGSIGNLCLEEIRNKMMLALS